MSYLKHKKGSLEEAVLEAVSKDVKEYVQADGTKRRVKEGDNRLKSNKLKIEDNTKIIIRPKITKDKCLKKNVLTRLRNSILSRLIGV